MDKAPRAEMRALVEEGAAGADLTPEAVEDLLLGLWEACAQATSHSGEPEVEVTVLVGEHAVEVEVRNPGVYRIEAANEELDDKLSIALATTIEMSLLDEVHMDVGTEENPETLIRMVKLTGG